MPTIELNYIAVIVAAVASIAIGATWYSMGVFGKMWMKEAGVSMKNKGMGMSYGLQIVGSLVMAYVLAHFVDIVGATDASGAWQLAFWVWLGFLATTTIGAIAWEGRTWKWWAIVNGHHLISLFVMTLILTLWT